MREQLGDPGVWGHFPVVKQLGEGQRVRSVSAYLGTGDGMMKLCCMRSHADACISAS